MIIMSDITEQKKMQVEMHTDFFDTVDDAIENGFYLEAIFREYAAIESRLEVILGVLGSPCGKKVLPDGRARSSVGDLLAIMGLVALAVANVYLAVK